MFHQDMYQHNFSVNNIYVLNCNKDNRNYLFLKTKHQLNKMNNTLSFYKQCNIEDNFSKF